MKIGNLEFDIYGFQVLLAIIINGGLALSLPQLLLIPFAGYIIAYFVYGVVFNKDYTDKTYMVNSIITLVIYIAVSMLLLTTVMVALVSMFGLNGLI